MLRDGVLAGWVMRGWSVDRDRLGSGGVFGGGGGCGEGGELGEGAACEERSGEWRMYRRGEMEG